MGQKWGVWGGLTEASAEAQERRLRSQGGGDEGSAASQKPTRRSPR